MPFGYSDTVVQYPLGRRNQAPFAKIRAHPEIVATRCWAKTYHLLLHKFSLEIRNFERLRKEGKECGQPSQYCEQKKEDAINASS
jgi:hypothetical protein